MERLPLLVGIVLVAVVVASGVITARDELAAVEGLPARCAVAHLATQLPQRQDAFFACGEDCHATRTRDGWGLALAQSWVT